MSSRDIKKMNYAKVQAMYKSMNRSAKILESSIREMNGVLILLQGGGLIGKAGNQFEDAIRKELIPSMRHLMDRYKEQEADLRVNEALMKAADKKSARAHRTG